MNIHVANQRILLLEQTINPTDAQKRAWSKKVSSFDAISKVGSFFDRPRDDDFELIYSEYRIEPFWHVVATAKYVYDRIVSYTVPVGGPEVQSVSYKKDDFSVSGKTFTLPVMEHCKQEEKEEVIVDGVTGKDKNDLKKYFTMSATEIKDELSAHIPKDTIQIPPQTRISAIVRSSLSKMIKGIQADAILEEAVEVSHVDLFYLPVYAFEYRWISKNKEAIVEVNAVTGETATGNKMFKEYIGKVLDRSFLFDIGCDAADLLIPGGGLAVKLAKKYIESR